MSRNAYGRDRVLITKDNLGVSALRAEMLLKDTDQYEFDSVETMAKCAAKANARLMSFVEVTGRPARFGAEEETFYQQQLEGITCRYYYGLDQNITETLDIEPDQLAWNNYLAEQQEVETDDISQAVSGQHYNDVVPGFQYMEMMQHMLADKEGVESHLLGQVYKYLMRAGKKDDVEQEYRKARWYLNALVKFKQTGEVDCSGND